MDTLAEFTRRTHERREGAMPDLRISKRLADTMVAAVDESAMHELAIAARAYLPAVTAEIAQLQTALERNPAEVARRALLFGIATPNRDETQSLAWAMHTPDFGHETLNLTGLRAMLETPYPSPVSGAECRIGLRESLAGAIQDAYATFPDITPQALTPNTLETLYGVGPKVARMIAAVANPDARVFTVDLWHARQLLWAAGMDYRVRASVAPAAYGVLEGRWLQYRDTYFADVPVWACQWSTWNAADGRHNPHNVLWHDLAA